MIFMIIEVIAVFVKVDLPISMAIYNTRKGNIFRQR